MKKLIFTCLALAAIASACTKSEVVDAPNIDTPISFEAYSGRIPVSKATSIDEEAELDEFVVHGFRTTKSENNESYTPNYNEVYLNETVEYSEGSWNFKPTENKTEPNVHYWPADGNELAFVAYSNNGGNNVTYNGSSSPSLTVTVPNNVADQKDIMVAKFIQCGAPKDNGKVKLEFKHILSRIHFVVANDRPLNIHSVAINGTFKSGGTVNLTSETNITASTEEETNVEQYEFVSDTDTGISLTKNENGQNLDNTPQSTEEDHYMMIIPAEASSIVIEYQFTDDLSETIYLATATLESGFKFEAGKSYLYKLSLTSQKVSFTVDFYEWDMTTESTTQDIKFEITKKG